MNNIKVTIQPDTNIWFEGEHKGHKVEIEVYKDGFNVYINEQLNYYKEGNIYELAKAHLTDSSLSIIELELLFNRVANIFDNVQSSNITDLIQYEQVSSLGRGESFHIGDYEIYRYEDAESIVLIDAEGDEVYAIIKDDIDKSLLFVGL